MSDQKKTTTKRKTAKAKEAEAEVKAHVEDALAGKTVPTEDVEVAATVKGDIQDVDKLMELIEAQRQELDALRRGKNVLEPQGPKTSHIDRTRIYAGDLEIDHDLFILRTSNTKREIGFNKNPQAKMWKAVPHQHRFHSHDSSGREHRHSCYSLGHTHEVYIDLDENGKIIGAHCSPPLKKGKRGKLIPYTLDSHTHDITYVRSEKIPKRVINEDGVKQLDSVFREEREALRPIAGL